VEVSTAAVAADFMEVAEQRFTGEEVSPAEAALGSSADAPTQDIVAAPMQGEATTEVGATMELAAVMDGAAAVTDGVAGIGVEDTATDGVGELALVGRIGVGDGDIRMAPTTTRDITRRDLIILTRPTVLRAIPRAIRILATGTTILHRQIPTHGHSLTRTDPQDTGRHRHRETYSVRTTETLPPRRVGRFCPLTG